jgi:hypothetical protein
MTRLAIAATAAVFLSALSASAFDILPPDLQYPPDKATISTKTAPAPSTSPAPAPVRR